MFSGKVWLTADLHFGHGRVVKMRPWKNADRHDNALIKNMREVVGDDDTLIIVGDLTLAGRDRRDYVASIVRRLPGKKCLVYGNYDKFMPLQYVDMGFMQATTSLVIGDAMVAHDPAWAELWPTDKPFICGHVHSLFRSLDSVVNVGVDAWNYKPVLLYDALAYADLKSGALRDWISCSERRHRAEAF